MEELEILKAILFYIRIMLSMLTFHVVFHFLNALRKP